ncbi:MAG: ComF family protein [bacterium]
MPEKTKNFFFDLFFPKHCFCCKKEGEYLCQDCQALLDISPAHQNYKTAALDDLYYALPYQNSIVKNLIRQLKYEPFAKELAKTLSSLILIHFQLLDNKPDFSNFNLIPLPLEKKRLKWRGFNQAEEIAKPLAEFFRLEILKEAIVKIKKTLPQAELKDDNQRKENIKNAFFSKNPEKIKGRKILLVDDVYTTGATMEEAARILKAAGAQKVVGIAACRG